jgi:photosystem II stability/assembly factor-like uncharacterized protein
MKKLQLFLIVILVLFSIQVNAQSWFQSTAPQVHDVNDFATSGTSFFAASSGGVLLSTNNGVDWIAVNNGLTDTTVMSLTVSGSNIFAGTSSGIFKSTDEGSNWSAESNSLTGKNVLSLEVSGTNIFAGTASSVFLSTDEGSTWTEKNNGLPITSVYSLCFLGANIFAGTSNGVFKSTDGGSNWVEANNGLTNTFVNDIDCWGSNLFVGTPNGIFISTDDGSSWTSANYNLSSLTQNTSFTNIAVAGDHILASISLFGVVTLTNNSQRWNDFSGPFIAVGGFEVLTNKLFEGSIMNAGIAYTSLTWMTPVEEASNYLPTCFALEQNYPNPFNPSTKISYQLPVSSNVTVKVFNLLGEVVRTLVDEQKEAGNYALEFNASHLPSGIYIYKINAGNYTAVKKMILLK